MKLVGVSWNVASSMQIIVVDRLASSQMACHHLAIAACVMLFSVSFQSLIASF